MPAEHPRFCPQCSLRRFSASSTRTVTDSQFAQLRALQLPPQEAGQQRVLQSLPWLYCVPLVYANREGGPLPHKTDMQYPAARLNLSAAMTNHRQWNHWTCALR